MQDRSGFGGGPTYMIYDWLIYLLICLSRAIDRFITQVHSLSLLFIQLFLFWVIFIWYPCSKLFLNCALTSLFDKLIVARCLGTYLFPFWYFYMHFLTPVCACFALSIHWFIHSLPCQLHLISRDPTLGT